MTTARKKSKTKRSHIVRMTLDEIDESFRKKPLRKGEHSLTELANLRDDEIDYSDIPEADEEFFRTAQLFRPVPKQTVTIRLDDDVLNWFKAEGAGYQSHINAALKAYMLMHRKR